MFIPKHFTSHSTLLHIIYLSLGKLFAKDDFQNYWLTFYLNIFNNLIPTQQNEFASAQTILEIG